MDKLKLGFVLFNGPNIVRNHQVSSLFTIRFVAAIVTDRLWVESKFRFCLNKCKRFVGFRVFVRIQL